MHDSKKKGRKKKYYLCAHNNLIYQSYLGFYSWCYVLTWHLNGWIFPFSPYLNSNYYHISPAEAAVITFRIIRLFLYWIIISGITAPLYGGSSCVVHKVCMITCKNKEAKAWEQIMHKAVCPSEALKVMFSLIVLGPAYYSQPFVNRWCLIGWFLFVPCVMHCVVASQLTRDKENICFVTTWDKNK